MLPAFVGKVIANVAGSAAGKALGKLIDRIPGKAESIRNKITKLEREQDELKAKENRTPGDDIRLINIANGLRQLHEEAKNRD